VSYPYYPTGKKVLTMNNGARRTLLLLSLLLLSSMAMEDMAEGARPGIEIICANSILADFTQNVVGDLAEVEYLMPAGVCPAHYDSRPSDANLVAGADIIVMMGWEGWLNGLITSTGNDDADIVKCMGQGDWNLPADAKGFVDKIATDLSAIMPEHSSELSANADGYKMAIDAKAAEMKARVEAEGVGGSKVVVMEWQRAFVSWLGFEVAGSYGPPEGLSVQDQLNVTEVASGKDVTMVVDNLQSGTKFGAHVASETGATHVILTNLPAAYPNADTYLDMIEYNTDKLIDGVKTFEFKQGEIASLEREVSDLEFQSSLYLTTSVILLIVAVFMGTMFVRARSRGG
jgi:ABC-type Zn uptake system ZnuABC Zn-binding protein ZnuA